MQINASVTMIKGVGEKSAEKLKKLGIRYVEDLLLHYPVGYRDLRSPVEIGELEEEEPALIHARVISSPHWLRRQGKFSIFSFEVEDDSASLRMVMFNQPYWASQLMVGKSYYFFGKPKRYRGAMQMDSPEIFVGDTLPGMVACYSLTAGVSQKNLSRWVRSAMEEADLPPDYSDAFCKDAGLLPRREELRQIHFPSSPEEARCAWRSVTVRRLLLYQRRLALLDGQAGYAMPMKIAEDAAEKFCSKLPFTATADQKKAMEEISADLRQEKPMNRVVQGDVGSGKTIVAFYAAVAAAESGYQTLMMAPTGLLAQQHFHTFEKLCGEGAALVTSATTAKERERIRQRIARGEIFLVIGTHALLYGEPLCPRLGLVITDEQHRFGVAQRARLSKGEIAVHTLVMSATPIPRTLSLILCGKASISWIREKPPGRRSVKTALVPRAKREGMYAWLAEEIKKGVQAYVVCPLVEPGEMLELQSVTALGEKLRSRMGSGRVGILHGRMNAAQKKEQMDRFITGEMSVLVSTTVIEVGVDVPNATVMIVEDADRFGLAQLHQLRGRVGRGEKPSVCYLVCSNRAVERLRILRDCADGYEIAEQDLKMRGAGELMGQRQHGKEGFTWTDLFGDEALLKWSVSFMKQIKKAYPEDDAMLTLLARAEAAKEGEEIVLN